MRNSLYDVPNSLRLAGQHVIIDAGGPIKKNTWAAQEMWFTITDWAPAELLLQLHIRKMKAPHIGDYVARISPVDQIASIVDQRGNTLNLRLLQGNHESWRVKHKTR